MKIDRKELGPYGGKPLADQVGHHWSHNPAPDAIRWECLSCGCSRWRWADGDPFSYRAAGSARWQDEPPSCRPIFPEVTS